MTKDKSNGLSRRERQIMDIIYKKGAASAAEVQSELPGIPNYSTVRALLSILEKKGQLLHKREGLKYIYYPAVPRNKAVKHAINGLLTTFFNNSVEQAVSALLDMEGSKLSDEELDRISEMISKAKREWEN